jgi:hypothetical protein
MRQLLLFVTVLMILVCSLDAQQQPGGASAPVSLPPTRPEVEKFMEVMQVRQRLQSSVQAEQEQINTVVHNMFHKALPDSTPAEKAKFEEIVASEFKGLFSDYPVDDVLRDTIPIYQSHFTESDLEQILAFYSSPTGKKVLKEMPAMMAEVTRVSLTRLQPRIDKVMENLSARIAAMVDADNNKEPSKPQ